MIDTNLLQNITKSPLGFNTAGIMRALSKAEIDPGKILKTDIPEISTWTHDTVTKLSTSFIQEGQLRDLLEKMTTEIAVVQDINIAIDAAVRAGAKGISQHKTLQEQTTHYSNARVLHLKSLDDSHKEQVTPCIEMVNSISAAPIPKDFMQKSPQFKEQMQQLEKTKQNREKLKTEIEQLHKQIKTSQREALVEYRYVYNPDDLKQVHPSTFEGVKKAPEITTSEKAKAPTGPAGGQTPTPTS